MTRILFTLHGEDGDTDNPELADATHVPRVDEVVTFDSQRSYQVIDVLWHLGDPDDPYVSITACELNWHKHIAKAQSFWENAHSASR